VTAGNTFLDQSDKRVFIEMYISDDPTLSSDDSHFSTPFDMPATVPFGFQQH
jgi:hypothetical protein